MHNPLFTLAILLLAGCTAIPERTDLLFDSNRQHLTLADRWTIARHLPDNLTLSSVIEAFPDGRYAVILEERLAQAGAHVGKNGKLYDQAGKEIYFYFASQGSGVCGGDPPEQLRERCKEFEELQAKYRIIVIHPWWQPPPC